jgi:hypothetical protein
MKETNNYLLAHVWLCLKWGGLLAVFLILMWAFAFSPELKSSIKSFGSICCESFQSSTFVVASRIIITALIIVFGVSIVRQRNRDQLE